ncbi:DUF5107 domain-containing protein [Amnibacterium sp. CER49]|uniref:DUF5107 domain-containing protein n=1 Tax=Amnibacterium sp. CER49 TaxID=3039161 RepID=UPI00244933E2|nr:DUF5107 domain-containing protein [Amnibacterium sp. CER49]MDH2442844.1 DUF5107 domain-containing protein [Amnibacterium sp. CER49]
MSDESRIILPSAPADQAELPVKCWFEPLLIDTYDVAAPDGYPQFLDARVYQGSSGKVFPLPFHDRVEVEKQPRAWRGVHLENHWLRLLILPELGGRVHIAYDKSLDYDLFYRNNVVKPALVGLTGPWISGGVEFNWPQHHRPATFLPTEVAIEREEDGSVTVWCSDHDPFARMKGMHGIRLRPDSSAIEARVRLFNRSEETQTFLWWANAAAAVNDEYQSFFPTDVHHVADHAKRAVVEFPRVRGHYYGVDYVARMDAAHPDGDRIDWYRNIPVPTSYMVTQTADSFFGGYDHGREAGFVHWADRAISPGKKQWTWGNAPFGRAWDANLTDSDGPYVELMAGVFTDNQPDFSFLAPGETKSFSQFWYPISRIGPAMQASREAAIRVEAIEPKRIRVGVATSIVAQGLSIVFRAASGALLGSLQADSAPGAPVVADWNLPHGVEPAELAVEVRHGGRTLVRHAWRPSRDDENDDEPLRAVAPPAPQEVGSVEELYLIGQYLKQYRHATRSPEPYWREALRRDPGDVRSNLAIGTLHYGAAQYAEAIEYLQRAVDRETRWVPNPADGEAHYRLGLALRRAGQDRQARRAFEKATWNAAQAVPAHLALARALAPTDPASALEHARHAMRRDVENLQVRDVLVVLLRRLGSVREAERLLAETLRLDPLDVWARHLDGQQASDDSTAVLDLALEYASIGQSDEAITLLEQAESLAKSRPAGQVNVGPLAALHRAALALGAGETAAARAAMADAATQDPTHALPSRLDDVDALEAVLAFDPDQPIAQAMLGSWYFDRGRIVDAVEAWRRGIDADPDGPLVALLHRNLGIAAYNHDQDAAEAVVRFDAARAAHRNDARLLYEADQLASRTGVRDESRLKRLDEQPDLVASRDDLVVERARLLIAVGQPEAAQNLLLSRQFQPWEGGEGVVLAAWDKAALEIARRALQDGEATTAVDAIEGALNPPANLGEARHFLATTADLHLALGDAYLALGRPDDAREAWESAAAASGDFTDMAPGTFTERSAWSIAALQRLGRSDEAINQLERLDDHIAREAARPAVIDFFATSLPSMLLFRDNPAEERDAHVARLRTLRNELANQIAAAQHDSDR